MQYALIIPAGFKVVDYQKSTVGKLTNLYQSTGKPATIQIESSAGGKLVKEELVIVETIGLVKEGDQSHNIEIYGYVKGEKDVLDNTASQRMRATIDFAKKMLII